MSQKISCPLCGGGADDEFSIFCSHPFHAAHDTIIYDPLSKTERKNCNWQDVNGVWTCTECGDKEW